MYKEGQLDAYDTRPAALFVIFTAACHVVSDSPETYSSTATIHLARQLHYGIQMKDLREVLMWNLVG